MLADVPQPNARHIPIAGQDGQRHGLHVDRDVLRRLAEHAFVCELVRSEVRAFRAERADLQSRIETNRAALVGGEHRALAMRYQALRARTVRHLLPGETSIPAPPAHDGLRVEVRETDPRTARSLALYLPSGASARAPGALRRSLLARVLGSHP